MNVILENVLVKLPKEEVKAFYVPEEEEKEKERVGEVVKMGESVPTEVKSILGISPKVKFKQYFDGEAIELGEESYIVMNYKDILLISNEL